MSSYPRTVLLHSVRRLVVLPIGWNFLSRNRKHYRDLGSERHQYGISALVTQTSFCEGSRGDLVKRQLFFPGYKAAQGGFNI